MTLINLIKKMQSAVNVNGAGLVVDGVIGPKTQQAFQDFYFSFGLTKIPTSVLPSINLAKFFSYPFGNSSLRIKQSQQHGYITIISKFIEMGFSDVRWLAYILATAFHETAGTLKPIKEYGSGDGPDPDPCDDYLQKYDTRTDLGNTPELDGDGELFAGKGFVQITGRNNYRKYGIEQNPDRALEPDFAAFIMIDGMVKGTFTGRKLADYFNANASDPYNARRTVNGLDKASLIAGYYQEYLDALRLNEVDIGLS